MNIYGLYCSACKKEVKADPSYSQDNFYICAECGKPLGYYCSGCEDFFEYNRLIFHDDLYVCKVCGAPQYGYTLWKNKKGRDHN